MYAWASARGLREGEVRRGPSGGVVDKSKIFLRDGIPHGKMPSAASERAATPARTPRDAQNGIEIEDGRGRSPAAGANLDEGLLELGDDAHGTARLDRGVNALGSDGHRGGEGGGARANLLAGGGGGDTRGDRGGRHHGSHFDVC